MKKPTLMRTILLSITLLASAMPAFAGETAFEKSFDKIWNRDKLTGDWGGLRSNLSKHGIDIDLRLSQITKKHSSELKSRDQHPRE